MRLVTFDLAGVDRLGIVLGDHVPATADLGPSMPTTIGELLADVPRHLDVLQAAARSVTGTGAHGRPLAEVSL